MSKFNLNPAILNAAMERARAALLADPSNVRRAMRAVMTPGDAGRRAAGPPRPKFSGKWPVAKSKRKPTKVRF